MEVPQGRGDAVGDDPCRGGLAASVPCTSDLPAGARLTGASSGDRRGYDLPLPPPPLAAGGCHRAGDTAFHPGHNAEGARGSHPQPARSGGGSGTSRPRRHLGPGRLQGPALCVTRRVTQWVTRGGGR